jgi:hypothetical protein
MRTPGPRRGGSDHPGPGPVRRLLRRTAALADLLCVKNCHYERYSHKEDQRRIWPLHGGCRGSRRTDCFRSHVAKGDIERILPGVYRLAGAAENPRQRLRAATLGGEGTAASHTSAAAIVGLKAFTLCEPALVRSWERIARMRALGSQPPPPAPGGAEFRTSATSGRHFATACSGPFLTESAPRTASSPENWFPAVSPGASATVTPGLGQRTRRVRGGLCR